MAKKVFAVYLAKEDVPNSEAYATLELPASPWEVVDALDKVRLQTDDISTCPPTSKAEAYLAFLPQHIHGM